MAKTPIPKVPEEEFLRVIKALVNTPPTPMAEISRKRKVKVRRQKRKPTP